MASFQSNRLKKTRRALFELSPLCYWCGVETIWMDTYTPHPPKNLATLDHLYSKAEKPRSKGCTKDTVLACYECNQKRNRVQSRMANPVGGTPKKGETLKPRCRGSVRQSPGLIVTEKYIKVDGEILLVSFVTQNEKGY